MLRTFVVAVVIAVFASVIPSGIASPYHDKRAEATCPYPYSSRSLLPRQTNGGLSFSGSNWIWTDELDANRKAPVGTRAFRKTISPPEGKTPAHLTVAFAVDNSAVLYVNGQEIATNGDWFAAGTYCVPLKPCTNVIAINATNAALASGARTPNAAGLLVTAEVTYTDGSTSHIASDSSWRVSGPNIPSGFEQLSFDDSSWATAVSEFTYPAVYGKIPIAGTDAISLSPAWWIWTTEEPSGGGPVPAGARAFRRTINLPPGHTSASAEILIVTDNEYSLYINGRFIGTGTDWHKAGRYTVDNIQGPEVVIAVYGVNLDGPGPNHAGVVASFQFTSNAPGSCLTDCSSKTYVVTDHQWKSSVQIPSGFEQPSFDGSNWEGVTQEVVFDPSLPITVPAGNSAPGAPLSGAPTGN